MNAYRNNTTTLWVCALLMCLSVSGCAINPQIRHVTGKDASLIYGYFDMSASPRKLESVRLTQAERSGIAFRQSNMVTYDDGLFFIENIPPMKYHIPWYMAGGVMHSYGGREEDIFEVKPGSMVFIGTYKYHDPEQGGLFTTEKFEMKRVNNPSEKQVLQKLLTRVKDPKWKQVIQARLKQ